MTNKKQSIDNPIIVVIMAGGKGKRLNPYTKIIPKALIPIGDIPIIERIISNFLYCKFNDFFITINYKKEIIKAYFNKEESYNINYLEEEIPLGTAGGLKKLEQSIFGTMIVTNCDILIDADYLEIIKYHRQHNYRITSICTYKDYVIPYGVLNLNNKNEIISLNEKPMYKLLINTGMYIIDKDILKYIPDKRYYDMTELIKNSIKNGESVGVYIIDNDCFLDMGEFNEMNKMIEKLDMENNL